jgi:hypothetical protein
MASAAASSFIATSDSSSSSSSSYSAAHNSRRQSTNVCIYVYPSSLCFVRGMPYEPAFSCSCVFVRHSSARMISIPDTWHGIYVTPTPHRRGVDTMPSWTVVFIDIKFAAVVSSLKSICAARI